MISSPILSWLSQLLAERFGIDCVIQPTHSFQGVGALKLELRSHPGRIVFTPTSDSLWQNHSNIMCAHWAATDEGFNAPIHPCLPAPGAEHLLNPLVEWAPGGPTIHYDILGLTYWMLTRLEEVGRTDLDEYNRFPATSSHAYRHGYLQRPLVDEWLDILGQVIRHQWPSVQLKQPHFNINVSHDVDRPTRYGYQPLKGLIRSMAGDLLKRRDLRSALIGPWIRLNTKKKFHDADPFNTFEWIMDESEVRGLTSAFYFICGRTHPQKDAQYIPDDAPIRALMRRINDRGHEIGLHPSFNTYLAPEAIEKEAKTLWKICEEEGISQAGWGGRMHYLRWRTPDTLLAWEKAGMKYDSTLGYADRPGFRCGTCHEYPGFDPVEQKALNIRVRPLIAMECSVMSPKYMNYGTSKAAYSTFFDLRKNCEAVHGTFTVLWHNSELEEKRKRDLYRSCLGDIESG